MTTFEKLVLRGLRILIRSQYAPTDPIMSADHYHKLSAAIRQWEDDVHKNEPDDKP